MIVNFDCLNVHGCIEKLDCRFDYLLNRLYQNSKKVTRGLSKNRENRGLKKWKLFAD